jgi:hypothetical protein
MESDDKREKTKKYEENRKAPKFNVKWLTNHEWLDYESFQRYLGLHWTFGPVKVELLPDQITFYWTKKN